MPFVDKKKIVINSFPWGMKINKILPPAPYFLVTLDDNLLIKFTWPYYEEDISLSCYICLLLTGVTKLSCLLQGAHQGKISERFTEGQGPVQRRGTS